MKYILAAAASINIISKACRVHVAFIIMKSATSPISYLFFRFVPSMIEPTPCQLMLQWREG